MNYFFIPGSHPALSSAEILLYFKSGNNAIKDEDFEFSDNLDAIIFKTENKIDSSAVIKRLGGTVKLGISNFEFRISNKNINNELLNKIVIGCYEMAREKRSTGGKFNFGISVYGIQNINIKHLGLTLKNVLKDAGISSRWVTSQEKNLSSVVVDTNKLLDKGIEIVIIKVKNNLHIGYTEAVQPFRELSFRDYGRPARDDHSGMLPPKLAQILINLAGTKNDDIILDPFCGSGTILTEAMLMGYQNLIGSDISQKAVDDTKKNIEWIETVSKVESRKSKVELIKSDSVNLSKLINSNSIDAIITEPYLGPQRGKHDVYKIKKELEGLYQKSLQEMMKLLKPGGRIVMVWPVFFNSGNQVMLEIGQIKGLKKVDYLPVSLFKLLEADKKYNKELSRRNTLIYGRSGQKVWREMVVLTK